ncbi:NUDIX domain-containing protein [Roseomonas gilardii]|uniref:NUDIX domain-containing protein n=1 Tax=Roseomonas gilardii TaxID=257708 RepID=A0ABU3M9X4_9PROT|nr:NUDIX domain-containing protein [Roseomonas gilardii]MDT8329672.1 NUDIX domain-containing protein [Roseomonas gilardii]
MIVQDRTGPERNKAAAARPADAASLILWRQSRQGVEVLMGLRSRAHRFMPGVLVFPGGRLDPADRRTPALTPLAAPTRQALERRATPRTAHGLAVAAARELQEETGLLLGEVAPDGTLRPDLAPLGYLCRAVTPPTMSIRFNARFLLAPAEAVRGSLAGSGELEALGWYPVEGSPGPALAPITACVLREFRALLAVPPGARDERPLFRFAGFDNRFPEYLPRRRKA